MQGLRGCLKKKDELISDSYHKRIICFPYLLTISVKKKALFCQEQKNNLIAANY